MPFFKVCLYHVSVLYDVFPTTYTVILFIFVELSGCFLSTLSIKLTCYTTLWMPPDRSSYRES